MEKLKFFIGIMDLIIAAFIIFLLIVGFIIITTIFCGALYIVHRHISYNRSLFYYFNSQSLKNKELLEEEKLKQRIT